jgi:hypothetical protein
MASLLSPLSSPVASFFRSLFYQQVLPHEILAIQHGNSSSAFPLRRHLHEGNASRLSGLPVLDNLDRNDASGSGKKRLEISLSDLAG